MFKKELGRKPLMLSLPTYLPRLFDPVVAEQQQFSHEMFASNECGIILMRNRSKKLLCGCSIPKGTRNSVSLEWARSNCHEIDIKRERDEVANTVFNIPKSGDDSKGKLTSTFIVNWVFNVFHFTFKESKSINLTDNSFRAVIVNLIRREIEKSYDGW